MRVYNIAAIIFTAAFFFSCDFDESRKLKNRDVTWNEVAPVLHRSCASCHRPGEAGGFNLLTYSDVVKRANQVRFVVRTRYMPPWPADPGYSHFAGENVLTQDEIDMIVGWVDNGRQRGDSLDEPRAPIFYTGSYFRKPDMVIRTVHPIQVKGNGADAFILVKYPYKLDRDTIIDFVEFVPHHRRLIHHVNGHLVSYDPSRKFDYLNGESVHADVRSSIREAYEKMHIPYTDGKKPDFPTLTPNTVYYLPGYIPPTYPKELGGYKMKKDGLFLLNNIHYGPSNIDGQDTSYLNVFFRKDPVQRPVSESQLGTFGISEIEPEFVIPPGEIKTFHTQFTVGNAISMLSVNPHMHLIGKTFIAYALQPGGDTVKLIRINKWDFRWQYYYTFKHPVKLEAGSTIHVFGTFDNTNENVNNPFHPPRAITQGNGVESMKTTEEMFQFIFTYAAYKVGDENINLDRRD